MLNWKLNYVELETMKYVELEKNIFYLSFIFETIAFIKMQNNVLIAFNQ